MNTRTFGSSRPLLGVLSAGLVAGVWGVVAGAAEPPGKPPLAALVVTSPVVERPVAEGRTFVGTVLPSRKSIVGSAVDGRVLELLVNDGDWVAAEQPLARLRTVTIELELAAAQAECDLRSHELAEMNAALPVEREQAQAALARSEALRTYARSRLARAESLFAKGGTTSQEELEQHRSAATAAEQSVVEATAVCQLLQQPRDERVLQAQALLAKQQAEVDRLKDQLKKYTIQAPFDGYVTAEHTEVGAWIKQGEPVVDVTAVEPVEVSVSVPEEYIAAVAPGAAVAVRLDALLGELLDAAVSRIVPQADVRSRSFPVKIALPNPRVDGVHRIKAGMLAHVTLAVGQPRTGLLVPKDALVLGGPTPLVFVVAEDPQTKQRIATAVPVQLGVADGDLMHVEGPLAAGQQVVVQGNERLASGQPVSLATETPAADSRTSPPAPKAAAPR